MSKDNWVTTFEALMPFVVASTMIETLEQLEWKDKIAEQMKAAFFMATMSVADSAIRALIGPELEKRGLGPLTDWHWQVFRQEVEAKSRYLPWLHLFSGISHEAVEREIIRRFVWEGR